MDERIHHEELAVYGTGIAHLILPGRPEYMGLLPRAAGPWVRIHDGSLALSIDGATVPRWRRQMQRAETDIARQSPGRPAADRSDEYLAMSVAELFAFAFRIMHEHPDAFDAGVRAAWDLRDRQAAKQIGVHAKQNGAST